MSIVLKPDEVTLGSLRARPWADELDVKAMKTMRISRLGQNLGFVGELYAIQLSAQEKTDEDERVGFTLVLKLAPFNAKNDVMEGCRDAHIHERECDFYRHIAPILRQVPLPRVYESAADNEQRGHLIMSYVADAHLPVRSPSFTPQRLGSVVRVLARLHAQTWHRDICKRLRPLLLLDEQAKGTQQWCVDLFEAAMPTLRKSIVKRLGEDFYSYLMTAFLHRIVSGEGNRAQRALVCDRMRRCLGRDADSLFPYAATHGDMWLGNCLMSATREQPSHEEVAAILDFQFSGHGFPLIDIALLMVSAADFSCITIDDVRALFSDVYIAELRAEASRADDDARARLLGSASVDELVAEFHAALPDAIYIALLSADAIFFGGGEQTDEMIERICSCLKYLKELGVPAEG